MDKIPSDVRTRDMLDPVDPSHFFPLFGDVMAELRHSVRLDAMRCLDGQLLIALDGTEYHRSREIHYPNCSHRKRGNSVSRVKAGDKIGYFHSMVAATVIAPGHNRAIPLEPEFIVPQDGYEKQDCESVAAQRRLTAHGVQYQSLDPVYLGDSLFSHQPICEAVLAAGGHFLFVCKPDWHPAIEDFLSGITPETLTKHVRRGKKRMTHRYCWLNGIPLRHNEKFMAVNCSSLEICDGKGVVAHRNSFISDLPADRGHVAAMVAAGRARWNIENEVVNTLKTRGYNLEHNFGMDSSICPACWPPPTCWLSSVTPSAISRTGDGRRRGANWWSGEGSSIPW